MKENNVVGLKKELNKHMIDEEHPDGFLEKDFKRLKRWCLF